jgi:hypothetical protein
MNDLDRQIRDALRRHEGDAPALDASDARHAAARTRRRQIVNVAGVGLGTLVIVIGLVVGVNGWVLADRSPTVIDSPTELEGACPSPASVATPAPDDERAHGWPGTSRNPAGVYSWGEVYSSVTRVELQDGSRPKRTIESTSRFMHNGYSPQTPGEVSITMDGVPGQLIPHSGQCAVVGGYEGTYRRFIGKESPSDSRWDDPGEEWMVDIEGTTVTITLYVDPKTPEAEVAEAHQIIESIHMVPKDNTLGFRLFFIIPTRTWDSG